MGILRERRTTRGLTLQQVADHVGTDVGNLSRIERGRQFPGRELAKTIADYYGIPVEQVLYPKANKEGAAA